VPVVPTTRYQGSKAKLVPWIWDALKDLSFDTALDAFGGTGSVAYHLKTRGKAVTYNDLLAYNANSARVFIEDHAAELALETAAALQDEAPGMGYGTFIASTFEDIYFLPEENRWLDVVIQNIAALGDERERALARHALGQACIIKRPYNLFHRKNLYMRTADVSRSFGNKASWDRPFQDHFLDFVREANRATFDSGRGCRVVQGDARAVTGTFDLVYLDPPYLNARGTGVDYLQFYHFLEGLLNYSAWPGRVDLARKHRPFRKQPNDWNDPRRILRGFQELFDRFRHSMLAVSYRDDGIPSEQELLAAVRSVKKSARVIHFGEYQYALSRNSRSRELLILAE
jgi:adenine-specific DNA methylase